MPKLPVLSGQEVIKLLSKVGFTVESQKGSHVKLKKRLLDRVIVIIVPLHRALDTGTLLNILKQADVTREELFKLMDK
ncbi:MAG: type II toxin-antitoxin system HicA family toxin [Candidatus Micrarchaeota archaeon]|nr:type II toxin-antitoxin system HicA family toxin [Candidatus Micrarchaeota archaeon]